jgi:hypothetical protein
MKFFAPMTERDSLRSVEAFQPGRSSWKEMPLEAMLTMILTALSRQLPSIAYLFLADGRRPQARTGNHSGDSGKPAHANRRRIRLLRQNFRAFDGAALARATVVVL